MKKTFEKHELPIVIGLIVLYIIANSFCMQNFGLTDYRAVLINFALTLAIVWFIKKLGRLDYYGLSSFPKVKEYLYFIPLVMLMSVNLWNGINITNTASEIAFYMLSMLFIGFLEEIIFRGFLFKMMAQDNVKSAIIVSSVTFGIGHIINLLNGAALIETLAQICYAVAVGYLFVIIFHKSKSLWPCIITHSVVNALSIFNVNNNAVSLFIVPVFMVVVSLGYAWYINKKVKFYKDQ